MSSRSSISTTTSNKMQNQVVSTPRTPRVYTQRKLSSARRVRDMRSLPEYDSRSLLADPLKAYSQPDALYEEKIKLTMDIDSLLAEIVPLREQAQLISEQFDEPDRDPLEEASEIEKRQKIESYQNEIESINRNLARFNEAFTVKNEEDLKGQIQVFRHEKSVLESEIDEMTKKLYDSSDKTEDMQNSPNVDIVQENNKKIVGLQKLLDELKKEEEDLLAQHEQLLNSQPTDISRSEQIGPYTRKLQQLQHIRIKRSVEFKKVQRNYEIQVKSMEALKAEKQKKNRERKSREAWNESFKSREAVNEENQRKIEENRKRESELSYYRNNGQYPSSRKGANNNNTISTNYDDDDEIQYETIKQIVIHRHKHKRYHHKKQNVEEEESIPPLENPLMFSTEVEKTESLHITQPQKKDQ